MTQEEFESHPYFFESSDGLLDFRFALGSLADIYNELCERFPNPINPRECPLTFCDLRLIDLYCRELRKVTNFFEISKEDVEDGYSRFENVGDFPFSVPSM